MTNREWLESLSDVELAIAFDKVVTCDVIEIKDCYSFPNCDECRLAWLQAEHLEDE